MGEIFSKYSSGSPKKTSILEEYNADLEQEENSNNLRISSAFTNVQEIECLLEWNFNNWRSLTKAKVSEVRSPLFKFKVKRGGNGILGSKDYIHRFKLICTPEYHEENDSVTALIFQLKPILVDTNKFEEMRRFDSEKFQYQYGKYAWYAYKSDGYFDLRCRGLPTVQSGALVKCDSVKLRLNCQEIPEKLDIVCNLSILRTDHF